MKRNHGYKELTQLQKLRKENEKLKRIVASLRKQLARIDLDKFSSAQELIEESYQEKAEEGQNILDNLKEMWKCHKCKEGYLEIVIFNKVNETFYLRKCNSCENRTKSKKYAPSVKGIIKGN